MANVQHLVQRSVTLKQIRQFFDERGFCEVQPPCLSRDCVVDAYLDPIVVDAKELGVSDQRLPEHYYLQTSPESAMKRMLAAGAPSIYSVGPVFRSGEAGSRHNVEFTMLEWYELGGDYESAIRLTADLVCGILSADRVDRVSYRDAFRQRLNLDPIEAPLSALLEVISRFDSSLIGGVGTERDDVLDVILSEVISPGLGAERPLVLTDYPLSQAALAKQSETDPACAARFEMFVRGIEIANGYDELQDASVLCERATENNRKRVQCGRSPLEVDTTLVQAMRMGLPACSGVALGVDRLLMVRVDTHSVHDVIPFSIFEA